MAVRTHAAAPLSPESVLKSCVCECPNAFYLRLCASPGINYRRRCLLDRLNKLHPEQRGGTRARLAASSYKPAIPSLILVWVRSPGNKMDHKQLLRSEQRDVRDCCVFIFPERWLNDNNPDSGIQLPGLTC